MTEPEKSDQQKSARTGTVVSDPGPDQGLLRGSEKVVVHDPAGNDAATSRRTTPETTPGPTRPLPSIADVPNQSLLESLPYVIIVKAADDLSYVYANKPAEAFFGCERGALVGRNDFDLFPEEVAARRRQDDRECLASGLVVDVPDELLPAPNNRKRTFRTKKLPLRSADGSIGYLVEIGEDITEQREALELWTRKRSMDELLRDVAVTYNQVSSEEEVYQVALERICTHTGWPVGHVFYRIDERYPNLKSSRIWYMSDPERYTPFRQITESVHIATAEGLPGRAVATKGPVWIQDIRNDRNFSRARHASDIGVRAAFAFPVIVEHRVKAVLEFFSPVEFAPDRLLLDTLDHVSRQIARVIERVKAEERAQLQARQQKMVAMLGRDALTGLTVDELFLRAVLMVRGTLDVELCDLLELDPDGNVLTLREGTGWPEGTLGNVQIPARTELLTGFCLTSDRPVYSAEIETEGRFVQPEFYRKNGIISSVCVAIRGRARTYGVIGIHDRQKRQFRAEQVAFVEAVSNVLAQALERRVFEEALRDSRERFARLATNIPGFVFRLVMDITGKAGFDYVSPGVREIFGVEPDTIMHDVFPLIEMIHPDDRARYHESVAQSARALEQWRWEGRIIAGGRTKWLQGVARPERTPDGGTLWDGVVFDDTAHKQAEMRASELLKQNRKLTRRILSMQEEEYKRLAREMHDELGQSLTAIKSDAVLIQRHSAESSRKIYESAEAIVEAADHIYGVTHSMIGRLRPSTLDDLGLVDTLRSLTRQWQRRTGIDCVLIVSDSIDAVSENVRITIYRIVQECLTNVARHAQADRVDVQVQVIDADVDRSGQIRLTVADNGRGADASTMELAGGHFGLLGIRERVESLGGRMEFTTGSGRGLRITVFIPLNDEET